MKNRNERVGICRLTLREGRFVKAHIIPRALTNIAPAGAPIAILRGSHGPPIRRWSSWYDPALVIRVGEDILSDYDTWGIGFLRSNHLVWSSWGNEMALPGAEPQSGQIAFREILDIRPKPLRLFFLSLLWRAAATSLPEFQDVSTPEDDLEQLRICLVENILPDEGFYPMSLVQLITRAQDHICAPFRTDMATYTDTGEKTGSVPILRFYFDGLSLLVRLPHDRDHEPLGDAAIGQSDRLMVQTMLFEMSRQKRDLRHNHSEALRHWPGVMQKLGVKAAPFAQNPARSRGGADST